MLEEIVQQKEQEYSSRLLAAHVPNEIIQMEIACFHEYALYWMQHNPMYVDWYIHKFKAIIETYEQVYLQRERVSV